MSLTMLAVVGLVLCRRPDGNKDALVTIDDRIKEVDPDHDGSGRGDNNTTPTGSTWNVSSSSMEPVDNRTSPPDLVTNDNSRPRPLMSTTNSKNKTSCCFRPRVNVYQKLTPQYFQDIRKRYSNPKFPWTTHEYEDWLSIWKQLNPTNQSQARLEDCLSLYTLVVLDQIFPPNLREVLNELQEGPIRSYPFLAAEIENDGNDDLRPRVLMLGDSITRDIVLQMKAAINNYNNNNKSMIDASIQGAPTNCAGFDRYQSGLDQWLGSCVWDVVQFNVGMHFKPSRSETSIPWKKTYRQGLVSIVKSIRQHSPSARVVLALTTPSPLDSKATTPRRENCPHYDLFHKPGFVTAMNDVAIAVAQEYGLVINDRYSAILPVLGRYQLECNIHYTTEGSLYLAKHDLEIISGLIELKV